MKTKIWLKYLIYVTVLFSIIVLRNYFGNLASVDLKNTFRFNVYYAVISLLLGVCIGLFLGLEHLINELRKEGIWKINLPKLILVGLPSLYFSLTSMWILSISSSGFWRAITTYQLRFMMKYDSGYISIVQMILGYVVITSFFKYNEKNLS